MSTLKSFLSILFISQTIHARSFNPCELENELTNIYNLTADESRNLTCVAQKYSQLTTNIINNGSKTIYYGIFQIDQKWCSIDKPGGKCNIKCEDLVNDDITDDIKCAQKVFQKLGKKAWKLNKNSGCKKEFNYLDEYCHKNANIDDTFQVQPDFCELARKLMTLYDISKIDATIWSCISEYSKTGNLNLRAEEENRRDDEESCVKTRDVECAIKNNKQTGISGFANWPAYEEYCKNITESTCFKSTKSVNRSDIIEQISNVQNAETSKKPIIFTTSTEVSVFLEDDHGNLTQYIGNDITSESPKVSQQTTEFLSDTLEKPAYDDKPTIEGHSKVRIMSADKKIVEYPEILESTSKSLDEIMLINSSLVKSTTELSNTEHTTEKYYETIDKCTLAKDLYDSGRIPQNLISTFICIAEHESGLNVSFIDSDGQQSRYGIFQIDNQIYCSTNDNINQCNVLCAHLVDDQFDNDFECVRHIYKKEGLNYWPSYEKSCKNINSNSLDYCFEQFSTSQRPSTILNREAEYHSTEATLNYLTHMEMTTLINGIESASSDGSLDFCEFSHQLKVNLSIGIWEDLVHYVCIADQISHLRPKLLNDDKLGIFSLKDNTCGKLEAGGFCSILCSSLLNDDLIDDAECMIKVYKELGLKEWNISQDSCKVYTPKILRCIDEGRFSVPSDDELDENIDSFIGPDSKNDEIQKHIENNLEMILSRANIGTESLEDFNKLDQTTLPSIEATSVKEDRNVDSEIEFTTNSSIQKGQDLETGEQITTEDPILTEKSETTQKYFEEEESIAAMKNLLDVNTSEESDSESTTVEPKNNQNDQTTPIEYDDNKSNENEEEAIVEINLLTTTIESLLSTEIADKDLESKEDYMPVTTIKIDERTHKVPTDLEFVDKSDEFENIEDIEQTTASLNESKETSFENDLKYQEDIRTEEDINFENDPEVFDISHEVKNLEITTESVLQITDQEIEDPKTLRIETTEPQRHQEMEIQRNEVLGSEVTKTEAVPITENYNNIEIETEKFKGSLSTEIHEIDDTTVPQITKTRIFSEIDQKYIHEESTSDIPWNFDDKIFEPEILNSESFLENTEKSPEEENTTNVMNIGLISTESAINQSDSLTENTEKFIEQETTTENAQTEKPMYLKSTTESSFTSNIFDDSNTTEDSNEQTTESIEQDETKLEETTVGNALLLVESDLIATTEDSLPKPTTENLYYTSIREIIEEYQKSNVKNIDNVQSKRNQNYSGKETTLDDIFEDYDDFVDELENSDQSFKSFNKHTTFPSTTQSLNIQQSSRINKCELARYMNNSGFPENLISTFICIAEHESELSPHTVKISRSYYKFGLFQIDDNIYCSTDEKINECEIPCELLTDDQYDNDFECVRNIYKKEGFDYWPSYENSCDKISTNALDYCYDDNITDENKELQKFQSTTLEMSQIENIPVTTDSPKVNFEALSIDNESKSIIRNFDLCELTRELYSRNISIDDIPQYLCIADIKSHLKIRIPNENEQSYGLFFINSEFCGQSESDGICSMKCSDLWDNNISDDVDCVYKIIQTNGTDKWNLNSETCQIYDNKVVECFDKTTELPKISELDFEGVQRNASDSRYDVITESMTDMIADMTDKTLEDLNQETSNLRTLNYDIESDEITTDETTAQNVLPIEQTTSKIIQILSSTASSDISYSTSDNLHSFKDDKLIKILPSLDINLNDQNLSKHVDTLLKNFTFFDVLPKNGSIIFNIFNFNIYGQDHDIKFTVNRGTELIDRVED
ncbi:unnamed protein product [Chironomus riparius]|uniref:lysozyme n=1 Tax=Chironomus riparius TaxID=315576 RepID=A0A9N9RQL8_9DIPT|nr:unnamed protein product [Chironomus riparius]